MKQRDLRNSLKSREAKIAAELKNLPAAVAVGVAAAAEAALEVGHYYNR